MKFKFYVLLLSFFSFEVSHGQFADAYSKAEKLLTELNETYPGLSAAVGYGNEVIWNKTAGYADVTNRVLVDSSHQFRYYSLSKSITGMALIKLMETGKLDIEKPIKEYLPDLPAFYEKVKVKYLINHTAGVRHYNKGEWMKISQDHCNIAEEAIQIFIDDPLESEPGQNHSYTSFGYVLLSHLIASLSGESYHSYIKKTLFDPLDVRALHPDQSDLITREVKYYTKWNATKQKGVEAKPVNNSCKFGGGGFVGTANAIVKLHLAMANGVLVSQEWLDCYYTAIPYSNGESTGYAFGISDNINDSGVRYHAHTGSALGASAVLVVYEKSESIPKPMVVAMFGNNKNSEMNNHIGKLASFFREEIERGME